MAYDLGKAYISIVPKADGMGRGIEKELAGVGARAGSSRKGGLGGKLWSGLKVGAVAAGTAVAGVLAGSVVKGFQRLSAIEQAEASLRGLGHSAEDVETIMKNALDAVKGTAFGLDEAAGLAAMMVGAGVKPGKELEDTIRLVGDAATIGGSSLDEMGAIFGKVAASGKLDGQTLNQLMYQQIGILPELAEYYGVTNDEARQMVSDGKVSFEDFAQVMDKTLGGSALEAGNTVQGAFANMGAAMGRFGAAILADVYPLIAPLLGKITDLFDYLTDAAGPAIESVIGGFKEWAASDQVQGMLTVLRDVGMELYERVLKPLGMWIMDNWKPIAMVLGGIVAAFAGGALIAAIVAVGTAIGGLFTVAGAVTAAIGAVVGGLTYFFTQTEAGQAIVETAWGIIKNVVGAVVDWFQESVWPVLVGGWDYLKWAVSETWPVIQSVFGAIGSFIQQIWEGVIQPALAQFGGFILETVAPIVQRLWTDYVQPAFAAIGAFTQWLWYNAVSPALSALGSFIKDTLAPIIVWLWDNVVSPVFGWIGRLIKASWEGVIFPALDALKNFLVNILVPAVITMSEWMEAAWAKVQNVVKRVVGWFKTWVWPVLEMVIGLIKVGFNAMRDVLSAAWRFVKDRVINPVVAWFRDTAWPIISSVINFIRDGFEMLRHKLADAWNAIKLRVIQPVVNWFRDTVKPLFDRTTDGIGGAFDKLKDNIGKAWESIKDKAKAPIRFVVETVVNKALIENFNKVAKKLGTSQLPKVSLPSGFAGGGILPGWSRMRDGDDQLVPMRRGEGVLVSEGLRTARDRSAFMAANAAGRRGVGFASLMEGGFAGGGILGKAWDGVKGVGSKAKDLAGDALDKVLDGVDFVAEALKDPSSIFKRVYDAVTAKMPGIGGVVDMAKGAGSKILKGVVDKVLGNVESGEGGAVNAPGVKASGTGWARASSAASALGLRLTSSSRPGARTAGNGMVSLHAQGRARDYAGSASAMRSFFNTMDAAPYPTELLYSPMGSRNLHRSGRRYANTGATLRNHYSHVHVGFAKGGIFDQGGMLQPGMTGINLTRKPEAVLDPAQTRAYQAHAEALSEDRRVSRVALSEDDRDLLRKLGDIKLVIGNRELSGAVTRANRAMGVHA